MKYYIITGERSADLHGSNLIRALKRNDVNAHIRFWGGDLMVQAGGELVVHYQSLSLMGFWEVLKHLFKMIRFMKFCQKDLIAFQPDVLILMDFAGFNLRVAKFAKKKGLRVFYYISPKIWAWKASRVKTIKKYVDKMFVILPFEKDFYKKHHYQVDYVGNPLVERVKYFRSNPNFLEYNQLDGRPIIAVLPGSRKQEVRLILKIMLSLCEKFYNYQFVIAGVDN
ncbi:MAG: lipid-A-disaccharide synthase, partial [Bacteroidetes bacterium]|nr:lipid-A-disaccharide synthase [Bacteroidota bacterium]